jgi:hypothetical protein
MRYIKNFIIFNKIELNDRFPILNESNSISLVDNQFDSFKEIINEQI